MAKRLPSSISKIVGAVALTLVFSGLLPVALRAADDPGRIGNAVDRAFRPLMKTYDVPGMEVVVTIGGRHYFFDYGVASRETNRPVTRDTLFEIGSLSKTFTATLVSYAQATGRISLDDHPGKYIPQLRRSAIDGASLIDLGTYTAGGLPLQFPDAVTQDGMVDYFRQWKPSAAPGTERRYSNPSIGLLGYITGRAMRGDFADLVETRIFPALGLGHSHIRVPSSAMDDYAWGYGKTGKAIRVNPGVLDAQAYGVKSTAADMIRFVDANIRPETLEGRMRLAVEGTHVGYFRIGDMVQGLGWEQYRYPVTLAQLLAGNGDTMSLQANAATRLAPPQAAAPATLFDKTGSTSGFGAYAAFVPGKRIGIVMLANRNFPNSARVTAAYAVLEELASEAP